MRRRFEQFMYGRYGTDQLSKFMLSVGVAFLILSVIFRIQGLNLLVLVVLGACYYRMFSKNFAARSAENQKYLNMTWKLRSTIEKKKSRFAQRKTYHFYKCPSCKQTIRIPRGKGKICITCPKCKTEFIKKS